MTESHQDVLLFIDNIFRFVQAGSEVSALMGRMPSAVGYQPTLANELGALQERITSTRDGSITSVQAVYVPADDLTDPAPATTFAHLDATTVLSRKIAEQGIYPAVDPLASTSRILEADIVGEEHYNVARQVQASPPALSGAAGHHRHPGHGRAGRGRQAHRHPCPQAAEVPVPAVLRWLRTSPACPASMSRWRRPSSGFAAIVDGECDDIPEWAFFNVGTLDDAKKKYADKLAEEKGGAV